VALTAKGALYRGGDRIFAIRGRSVSVAAGGSELHRPNGITWDPQGRRWIVVSFDPFHSEVYSIPAAGGPRSVLAQGLGKFDGVERLRDGRLLVTSWADSSLHIFAGGTDVKAIRDLWQPADLGVDTRRGRVAIPLTLQGRMEVWELPAGPGA
jgi:hypothetical protein